jgi:hypothetical protein
MSVRTGAHDPSGPSGHLPFADSAKGRKGLRRYPITFFSLSAAISAAPNPASPPST